MSRKERKEARRQEEITEHQEQKKTSQRNSMMLVVMIAVPIVLVGGLIAYGLTTSKPDSTANIPDVGKSVPLQGQDHIAQGAEHPLYNSNPPTSGWHYDTPADWGIYKEEFLQERLVHNLEHGGIVIQYKPELAKETVALLEELKTSEFECKLVIAPYSKLDKNIALTAWGRLYKTDDYNETDIKNFIQKYRETGPEFVPCNVKASQMQR